MLTIGALLFASALLAFAAVSRVCDRPVPPRWTRRSGAAELLTMILATIITAGLACLAVPLGLVAGYEGRVEPVDLGLVALVLVGTVVLWRRLSVRERMARPNPASVVLAVPSAPGTTTGSAPVQPSPAQRAA